MFIWQISFGVLPLVHVHVQCTQVMCAVLCDRYMCPCNHAADEGFMGEAGLIEYQDREPELATEEPNLQPGTVTPSLLVFISSAMQGIGASLSEVN